ncbi:hypothetical protein [Sporolactobacillus spathodeae]|uniref:t-SNARE coiled-coil homology domain-containing protein n=1 Tax=Sporolactobacillus spathodeae TaxID=1465502 RepID=A0ABS2Q707_9BACL|nr:hypothetical protein [Sporolactobacillus spathodeae]MBM7657550.1 hypothetical protein [Sporolactobacillus spathodeae]
MSETRGARGKKPEHIRCKQERNIDRVGVDIDRVGVDIDRVGVDIDRVGVDIDRARRDTDRVERNISRVINFVWLLRKNAAPAASERPKRIRYK